MEDDKENRISIEDLPQAEQELTPQEAKEVQGGLNGNLQIADLTSVATDPNPTATSIGRTIRIELHGIRPA